MILSSQGGSRRRGNPRGEEKKTYEEERKATLGFAMENAIENDCKPPSEKKRRPTCEEREQRRREKSRVEEEKGMYCPYFSRWSSRGETYEKRGEGGLKGKKRRHENV